MVCGLLSVRWLFVVGSVPTDFFNFSNLFAKTPLVAQKRPHGTEKDQNAQSLIATQRMYCSTAVPRQIRPTEYRKLRSSGHDDSA